MVFALLFLLAASGTAAQQPSRLDLPPNGTIRLDVNLVLVEATVKNKAGGVIDGLKPEDFEIRENGVPQTVAHFSRDQLPLAVAVVVDLSSSITPFLRPLRYATQSALKALKPEDEVALFTFSDRVDRRVDLTHNRQDIAEEIEMFSTGGATNINRAIYEAARYLRVEAPAARRVIVLVSDNVPTAESGETSKMVLDQVLEADASVYSLKIPGDNPLAVRMMQKTSRGLVNVGKLAEETGGEVFDVEKEGSLFLAFQALIERLKTRYTLGYYSTDKKEDGSLRKLEISLAPRFGKKGHDYRLIAKSGYYAPRGETPDR
jgi:Ca-activated chloride channel family protein